MATTFDFQHRYDQLIEMNEQAFQDGYLDLAYHALLTAFECAHEMGSTRLMSHVGDLAQEELDWIDENQSGYAHSTRSAAERHGGKSIYQRLSNQATRIVSLRKSARQAGNWTRK